MYERTSSWKKIYWVSCLQKNYMGAVSVFQNFFFKNGISQETLKEWKLMKELSFSLP